MTATTLVEPRSSAGDQPLGLGAHARGPADDHLAGEPSVELLVCPPAPGERLLHRHHRSNVLRGNLCAEPEAPPPDLEYHVRPHPPGRSDSREQVGIAVPDPREHSRDHRVAVGRERQIGCRAQRIERQHPAARVQQREPVAPARERHRRRLDQVDLERSRQPPADFDRVHAGHRVDPAPERRGIVEHAGRSARA